MLSRKKPTSERSAPSVRLYKQGFLTKQGGSNGGLKNWKRRWFVFASNRVAYYESPTHYQTQPERPLGSLPIDSPNSSESAFAIRDSPDWTRADQSYFEIVCCERRMNVKADSVEVKNEWLEAMRVFEAETRQLAQPVDFLLKQYNIPCRQEEMLAELAHEEAASTEEPQVVAIPELLGKPWDDEHEVSISELSDASDASSFMGSSSSSSSASRQSRALSVGTYTQPAPGDAKLVSAATLSQLIQRLTDFTVIDIDFRHTFFLYHPCFANTEQVFDQLATAYEQPPSLFADYRTCIAHRLNVISIIRDWISFLHCDYNRFAPLLDDFLRKHVLGVKGIEDVVGQVNATIADAIVAQEAAPRFEVPSEQELEEFAATNVEACDFDAQPLASQITAIDFALFSCIKPREFVDKAWARKHTAPRFARNILAMIDLFNRRSFWVASEILSRETLSDRIPLMELFVRLASKLLKMHNFFSAFSVVSGLSLSPVYRLKTSWNGLSSRIKRKFEHIKTVISTQKNYAVYRRLLRTALGARPQLPHIAVVLKDLCQIDELKVEHGPDEAPFAIFQRQWVEVAMLMQCQRMAYPQHDDRPCFLALHACLKENLPESKMWERSYRFEPKAQQTPDPTE